MQLNIKKTQPIIEKEASIYNGTITIQLGEFGRKKHAYYWVEKDYFIPGVTSTLGILDKPALIPWAASMASGYIQDNLPENADKSQIAEVCKKAKTHYRDFTDKAADIGTEVHLYAQNLFKGEPIQVPDNSLVINGVQALHTWLNENQVQPIDVEQIVFSKSAFFAGMVDLLAGVNGKLSLVDFKTGKDIYREHRIQTAGAYRFAWEEEHQEQIEQVIIVNTNKLTGIPKIEIIDDPSELQLYADIFLRTKSLNDLLKKLGDY